MATSVSVTLRLSNPPVNTEEARFQNRRCFNPLTEHANVATHFLGRPGGERHRLHQSHHGEREGELRREGGPGPRRRRRRHSVRGGEAEAKDDHHGGDIFS